VMLFEFLLDLANGNSSNESIERKSESRRQSASATFAPNFLFAIASLSHISRRALVSKANSNAIHCPVADSEDPSRTEFQLKVACDCFFSGSNGARGDLDTGRRGISAGSRTPRLNTEIQYLLASLRYLIGPTVAAPVAGIDNATVVELVAARPAKISTEKRTLLWLC
jgi:hypothetical protein